MPRPLSRRNQRHEAFITIDIFPLFLFGVNETENLKVVTNAWLIAWAFAYLATVIFAPEIAGNDVLTGQILYATMGLLILVSLALLYAQNVDLRNVGMILLFVLALFSVYGAVASWSGLFVWNVPFQAKEVFQVTMGLMDFLGAVFMLIRAAFET